MQQVLNNAGVQSGYAELVGQVRRGNRNVLQPGNGAQDGQRRLGRGGLLAIVGQQRCVIAAPAAGKCVLL